MRPYFFALCVLWLAFGVAQAQAPLQDPTTGARYIVEEVSKANFPVGMVFLPDGAMLYNEKTTGNVRLIHADGTPQREPVLTLPTDALQERGMLGITIDPAFTDNGYVYVVHTRTGDARNYPTNTLVRFTLIDGEAQDVRTLARYPITTGELLHNGGNVHFSPDGHLFLSLGDFGKPANAQDLSVPQGKLLRFRLTEDGTLLPAVGNPYGDDNPAYAIGLRNPFDFTFDPVTGNLFSAEVGPSCDDEINLILPGFNYGWDEGYQCSGRAVLARYRPYMPPLLSFTPVIAPTGIAFYVGDAFPMWQNDLFFCDWNFGELRRVVLNSTRTGVESVHLIPLGDAKCKLDLLVGADGALYFGTVGAGGGAIMRLRPYEAGE